MLRPSFLKLIIYQVTVLVIATSSSHTKIPVRAFVSAFQYFTPSPRQNTFSIIRTNIETVWNSKQQQRGLRLRGPHDHVVNVPVRSIRVSFLSSSSQYEVSSDSNDSNSDNDSDNTNDSSTNDSSTNDSTNSTRTLFSKTDAILTTKSSVLDQNLTSSEKSVVNVVRLYGPSVAYVTSYSIPPPSSSSSSKSSKQSKEKTTLPPPRSMPLGSGSAFAISSNDGYFLTNYHVIERAYKIQSNQKLFNDFVKNITKSFPFANQLDKNKNENQSSAQVYLRLGQSSSMSASASSTTTSSKNDLIPARIVSVKPELDTAILQLQQPSQHLQLPQPIPLGSSSTLLVGQTVLAIGNPFGLDQTITTGVVSALNRPIKSTLDYRRSNQSIILNCIQTDAAINPGNSGGPLLNSNGECIGMNTMIISTSGSNAGIGFAIGIDELRDYVDNEIELDRLHQNNMNNIINTNKDGETRIKKRGWLGIEIVKDDSLDQQLRKRLLKQQLQQQHDGVFIIHVDKESPAFNASIQPTFIDNKTSRIYVGDRIIAINSKLITSYQELFDDLRTRVVGEQLSITLEDKKGDRRVVYVQLGEKRD